MVWTHPHGGKGIALSGFDCIGLMRDSSAANRYCVSIAPKQKELIEITIDEMRGNDTHRCYAFIRRSLRLPHYYLMDQKYTHMDSRFKIDIYPLKAHAGKALLMGWKSPTLGIRIDKRILYITFCIHMDTYYFFVCFVLQVLMWARKWWKGTPAQDKQMYKDWAWKIRASEERKPAKELGSSVKGRRGHGEFLHNIMIRFGCMEWHLDHRKWKQRINSCQLLNYIVGTVRNDIRHKTKLSNGYILI